MRGCPWRAVVYCLTVGLLGLLLASGCSRESAANPAVVAPSSGHFSSDEGPNKADEPQAIETANAKRLQSALVTAEQSDEAAAGGEGTEPAPAQPAAGQRPPADRGPSHPGEAEKVTFDDLNIDIQPDAAFRPFMLTDRRAKELDGKRISIVGYMYGGVSTTRGIKEFILLRNKECKFGPGGQADHLAQIFLKKGLTTEYTPAPVKVEATLKIEPFQGPDGNTWSIYRLEDAQIR
jgi:hypothetical protein